MIIRLNSEANLVKATEVKLIKTSDYQDTLTFKLPLDERIFVDELVGVRTKVMKQDYRVKEIITKDRFKDVYCEHKFFDCKNIIIPFVDEAHRVGESYNDFSRYNDLQSIVAHLNRIMRTKGDTEYKFSTEINKSGVVECDDTPLFDLIFGEKGILKTFNVELVYDNYKVKFVSKRPSKNTEILFHENKNVSELQETIDFKNIVTKLHITCKYSPDKTEEGRAERERLRAEKRREIFNKSQEKIKERETRQAQERALRRQKQEEEYQANKTAPRKSREEIHAEHLRRQQETENRILASNETRRQERERKFTEREQQRVSRRQDKEDTIFRTVFTSPLVSRYARPYEASLNFQSSEINSEETLIAWCNANLFTEEDTRDVPLRNFSFKPVEDDYNVDINDKAMVNFTSIDTRKIVHCCKIEYDALHDKYLNIEFGVLNKSAIRETIGSLNAKISETNSNISRTYDILDKNFDDYVQKELEAYGELFRIDKEEIEDTVNQGVEESKIEAEKVYGTINTDIENKLIPIREEVNNIVNDFTKGLPERIKENLKGIDIDSSKIDELKEKIEEVSEKAETTLKMVGTDGIERFNKNRLDGGTERDIPLGTPFIEISHNGDGFEVGKPYVISWEATCRTHDNYNVKFVFNRLIEFPIKVIMQPTNTLYPTAEKTFTEQEGTIFSVYNGGYNISFESEWYKIQNTYKYITTTTTINVEVSYKDYAEGIETADYQGEWNNEPKFIFDGGGN